MSAPEAAAADGPVRRMRSGVASALASRLTGGVVRALLVRVCGVAALFLMHWVLARTLSPSGYGVFTYTVAVASMAAFVVPLGWPVVLSRYTAQYVEQERWGLLRGLLVRAHQTTVALGLVASLAFWGATLVLELRPEVALSLRFAAAIVPLFALVQLRRNTLQGLRNVVGMLVPDEVVLPAVVLLGVALLGIAGATEALWLYLAAVGVAWVVGSRWLLHSYPAPGRGAAPEFRTREWMMVALPLLFSGIGQQVLTRVDVFLLGNLGKMYDVGLYGAANRLAIMIPFFMLASNAVVAPMLSAAYHGGRRSEFFRLGRLAILISAGGAAPVFLALFLFPGWILALFGEQFEAASTLLRVLAVGQLVNAATGPVGFMLIMGKHERLFAACVIGAVTFAVAGHLYAIPLWGGLGAAVVTSAAVGMLNLSCLAAVWRLSATGRL